MTKSPFWQSVSELAAMRAHIPEERRALSGVRHAVRLDVRPEPNRGSRTDSPPRVR